MLKKKVIASSINNLTDARYFAGWMVDAFVFSIDSSSPNFLSPQEIGTFQSWVEGPEYYLEVPNDLYSDVEKQLVDLNCQGICIPFAERALVANLDLPVLYKLQEEEISEFLSLGLTDKAIVSTSMSVSEISKQLQESQCSCEVFYDIQGQEISEEELIESAMTGFMVHGSPEEKVGFKSYDELDEIFEVLQDF